MYGFTPCDRVVVGLTDKSRINIGTEDITRTQKGEVRKPSLRDFCTSLCERGRECDMSTQAIITALSGNNVYSGTMVS